MIAGKSFHVEYCFPYQGGPRFVFRATVVFDERTFQETGKKVLTGSVSERSLRDAIRRNMEDLFGRGVQIMSVTDARNVLIVTADGVETAV